MDDQPDDSEDTLDSLLDRERDCPWCKGAGEVTCFECEGEGCNACVDGRNTCGRCHGTGVRNDAGDWDYDW